MYEQEIETVRKQEIVDPTKESPFQDDIRKQLRLFQFIDQDRQRQTDQKREHADQQTQEIRGVFSIQDVHFFLLYIIHGKMQNSSKFFIFYAYSQEERIC